MAAPESTKFQINYKLNDGTLINLYATEIKELETGLNDLSMVAALIKSTAVELSGGSSSTPTVAAVAQQFNATPVAAPVSDAGAAPVCKHGPMTYKSGTSAKGPWRAWMCPSPKGAVDKCETSWIR
jgi:hypothetical protein